MYSSDALVGRRSYQIGDDKDLEYMMVVLRSLQGSTKFYVIKSFIKGRDNQQDDNIHEEDRKDHPTYDWTQPQSFQENGDDDDDNDNKVDEDYDVKGDVDDEFMGFDDSDDMYNIPISDIWTSQTNACNDGLECSIDVMAS